jgi:methylmalonyl-CoA decarboxylase subunit alpha
MYLGSPRMAEMVIGETPRSRRWAAPACTPPSRAAATTWPSTTPTPSTRPGPGSPTSRRPGATSRPATSRRRRRGARRRRRARRRVAGYDMHAVIDGLVDAESFFEVKPLFAPELIVRLGLLDGPAGRDRGQQPGASRAAVLFVDSADKAARFIWLCDAFNVPLLFLADVPGFMIGTQVERQGIIRHGAKMVTAVSEATVPKVSWCVRKAYGAGLYAMCGPAFEPEATIALPTPRSPSWAPRPRSTPCSPTRSPPSTTRRARGLRGRAAPALRGGRRPAAPGVRAGGRRRRPAQPPARRAEVLPRLEPGRGRRTAVFSDRRHGVRR